MKKFLPLFNSPLISIGLFFLVNPTFSLFDLLPDFIGYMLVFAGIYELSALDDRLNMASKKLWYLALISALRLVAAVGTLGYDSSTVMMLTFVFSICEAVVITAFLSDWFGGFDYFMQRFDGFSAMSVHANTAFLTGIFFYTKIALGFIPEICAIFDLRSYFDIDEAPVWTALSSYKPYAMLLFGLIVFIMGIYWYINTLSYFKKMRSDTTLIENAGIRYSEIAGKGRMQETLYTIADYCVIGGFVFTLDFTLNLVPVLPSGVSTLLFFIGVLLLKKHIKKPRLLGLAAVTVFVQTAFEVYIARHVNTNAKFMAEIDVQVTVTLAILAITSGVFSVLYLNKAQSLLAEGRLATTELSPEKSWKKYNIFYCIFLVAHGAGLIFPMIGGYTLWIKLVSEIIFVTGGIVSWNKSIKYEE